MKDFDNRISNSRISYMREQEEERLIKAVANQFGYNYVDLRGVTINPEALNIISVDVAHETEMLPFEMKRKNLSVAIHNPNNEKTQATIKELEEKGFLLNIFMTSASSLTHGFNRLEDIKSSKAVKHGLLDIDPENIERNMKRLRTVESVEKLILNIRTINSARRVSETLETIFAGAIGLGASDIHIEPEETGIRLRYRLDGVLQDVMDLENMIYKRLISRIKLLSGMILNKHNEAQDGRFSINVSEKEIEVRSSLIPGAIGESMVMRLLDPSVASFSMESLGLNDDMFKVMEQELARPNGMIITTGPTGSGKTTALYAFMRTTHKPGVKIITIEDPVEYKIENIVQTQVGVNYSFASGLRSILRQDPDIIMVGEIRDREVAETAVHAAQTGHLVFTTLHTNSAVGAFPRLLDLGVDPRVMGSSINIIIGQRLVRKLCENCKEEYQPSSEEKGLIETILKTHPNHPPITNDYKLYRPVGCKVCNDSGFRGRCGVFEAIKVDDAVEEVVIKDPREHVILEAAKSQAIPTMPEHGVERVMRGETSLSEVSRVVDLYSGRHMSKNNQGQAGDLDNPTSEKETLEPNSDDEFFKHIV